MLRLYVQDVESIGGNLSFHELLKGLRQLVLVKTDFDSDFPVRCGTHVDLIIRIGDQDSCRWTQGRLIQYEPQEGVRIEEQPMACSP